MKLDANEQQQLIESSVLSLLAGEYDFRQRTVSVEHPHGCAPAIWQRFADMGWLGLPLPESTGGFGCGALEIGLLMRAFGRHLVVEPYHACVLLAGRLIAELGSSEQRDEWLPLLIAGEARVALAHDEPSNLAPWTPRHSLAARQPDGWRLRGRKLLAAGAPGAGLLLVTASVEAPDRSEPEQRVFLLRPDTPGLTIRNCATSDGSRASDLSFEGILLPPEALLGEDRDAAALLYRVHAEAVVAACWEACGAMTAAFEQTASYTQQRVQFGQPLARFQVVAHRLAEMAVRCEEAQASCELAALKLDRGDADPLAVASMAKSKVGRCADFVAKESVQLHGAMGVSEELPIASCFRKLNAFGHQGGTTAWHAGRLGESLLESGTWRDSATLPAAGAEAKSRVNPTPVAAT